MARDYAPAALVRAGKEADKEIPGCTFSGVLGDSAHTYGYHRGRCVLPRTDYSVQLAPDKAGPDCAASALDLSFTPTQMKVVTKRLRDAALDPNDIAMRAVREFYGTLNGRTVFGLTHSSSDGYWTPATSDRSHLWHIHISFFRLFCDNYTAARRVVDVMLGKKVYATPVKPPVKPPVVPKPPATPTYRTHTVVAGETLSSIAEKYGTTVGQIVALNGITDPNAINVGQVLKIPGVVAPPVTPKPPPAPVKPTKVELPPWTFKSGTHFSPYLNSTPPTYATILNVQRKLKELGYNPGPIDGRFGATTRDAVLAFQRKEKLAADGLIGPETYNRLRSK